MKTTHPDDLLSVVDRLTKSTFEHVAFLDDGRWVVRSVEVPPLLELMRDAVLPSSGADAGSKSAPNTRNLMDWEAMLAYHQMATTCATWARDAGAVPSRDPITDLRVWYAATLTDSTRNDDWFRRHLLGWVKIIDAHLEPPMTFTIQRACPVCRTEAYGNAIDGGDQWPIEVRYRVDDNGHTTGHTATCRVRSCSTRWLGYDAVMELAEELNENEVH